MERDPKTGRFLKGNQVAAGNKGNKKPKWRNRNAVTHGYDAAWKPCWIDDDECLCIETGRRGSVIDVTRIAPGLFQVSEEGNILLREDFARIFHFTGGVKLNYLTGESLNLHRMETFKKLHNSR
jgi:hypothetical protein